MRFGVLGTGHWATHTQASAIASHPDVELAGVWGRNPDRAAALGERFGVPAYQTVADLLAVVDAVAIAVPPDVQAELAVQAARAGKHLLLDKPLALTVDAADAVVRAVDDAGVACVVFFTNRFIASIDAFLRDAARQDWDGARATMFASIFQPGSPYADSPWRHEKGGLWDIGPHALSVVVPVLGPVTGLTAMAGRHDTSHLVLRHESGAVSTIEVTLDAPPAATYFELTFYGPQGRVGVPEADLTQVQAFGVAIDQLLSTVATGQPHPFGARFGRDVVAILAEAERQIAIA
jgi:predicted dehydrogenase